MIRLNRSAKAEQPLKLSPLNPSQMIAVCSCWPEDEIERIEEKKKLTITGLDKYQGREKGIMDAELDIPGKKTHVCPCILL